MGHYVTVIDPAKVAQRDSFYLAAENEQSISKQLREEANRLYSQSVSYESKATQLDSTADSLADEAKRAGEEARQARAAAAKAERLRDAVQSARANTITVLGGSALLKGVENPCALAEGSITRAVMLYREHAKEAGSKASDLRQRSADARWQAGIARAAAVEYRAQASQQQDAADSHETVAGSLRAQANSMNVTTTEWVED